MKYLLDTTWVVEYLRGNADVISNVQKFQKEGLAVSILSVAELYEGIFRSQQPTRNERSLQEFLSAVTILDLTETICRTYGEQKVKLLHEGAVIGALDLLIASTALAHGLTLLTKDRDFERVGNLDVKIS